MIIWIIGLSGAGKTTLARTLVQRLRPQWPNLVHLDGDDLREVWGDQLGHDLAGREINAQRLSKLSALLDRQGIHVVASVLSIFPDWQRWNRANMSRYFEVFLDPPFEELLRRDRRNLYSEALAGRLNNVVGVDLPFPPPTGPDLVLSGADALQPPETLCDTVWKAIAPQLAEL